MKALDLSIFDYLKEEPENIMQINEMIKLNLSIIKEIDRLLEKYKRQEMR